MDTIDLERTARLPVVKIDKRKSNPQPHRYGRPRVAKRKALPLTGAALERWQRWAAGDEDELLACRRAVV